MPRLPGPSLALISIPRRNLSVLRWVPISAKYSSLSSVESIENSRLNPAERKFPACSSATVRKALSRPVKNCRTSTERCRMTSGESRKNRP